MLVLMVGVAVLAAVAAMITWAASRHATGGVVAGDGPFRAAATSEPGEALGDGERWTVGFGIFWGLCTLLGFAPAGGLLATMMIHDEPIGGGLVGIVSLSGAALALSLIGVGVALLQDTRRAGLYGRLGLWSMAHHVAVVAVFLCLGMLERGMDAAIVAVPIIPCVVGLVHGWSATRVGEASVEVNAFV